MAVTPAPAPEYVVLYDGDCGVCAKSVQFLLPRDKEGVLHYAPLQSTFATELLERNGLETDLSTFVFVQHPGTDAERVETRSTGVREVLKTLGGGWRALGLLGGVVPRPVADALYGLVANNRHRLMMRPDRCLVPAPEHRRRFIAAEAPAPARP